jgi:superfamily II DNA or RNA helicase
MEFKENNNFVKPYNTYLGQKGYTISKNELTVEQQKKIRSDLTIKPFTSGGPVTGGQVSFPAYRESNNKMYVPHYYGVENFGIPKEYKISEGDDIDLEFNGTLRDYQIPVAKLFVDHCLTAQYGGGLLELPCAWGKTSLALHISSQLNKKVLVIVHKEFLMNQWIERIRQFLPKARVGKIQGQIIDIDNKDIVIGMLQSLSMKEYPAEIFESFGFTIVDEVHHISSEVFSNSLFKIITKYMLGLSATMNRKDGTTFVFKMFLGNVVFKGKRDESHAVVVRGIEYQVDDDEFNEVKLDFRGKPAYSSMISKLCEYNRRSEFILKVLVDMLEENPNQQVMILAHNKNLLKYLHDAIKHRNIASVGYYIGGMKESALKETEGKKIVIATYAMAAEALDIKTLTTLIMATPKTDIEQSVGRILREKHSQPVVVDIIDSHDVFKNQWRKRKTFYKRENYKIIYTTSHRYIPDASKWIVDFYPKTDKAVKREKVCKKSTSIKSNSSTDKSITNDSDEDDDEDEEEGECESIDTRASEPKDKYLCGKCFLTFKK